MEEPLEVVAEQLGHASTRVTKVVYGHLMPRSRANAAEAMRELLFAQSVHESPAPLDPLAVNMTVIGTDDAERNTLIRTFVGRPDLDPGTLGIELGRSPASVVVRLSWSEAYQRPPTSAEVLSNLLPWLHDWLHTLGSAVVGDVQIRGVDGLRVDLRVGDGSHD